MSIINNKIFRLSFLAVLFGSLYTIFRKFQSCAQLSDPNKTFNQPLIQSFLIFIGMASIGIFKPFFGTKDKLNGQNTPSAIDDIECEKLHCNGDGTQQSSIINVNSSAQKPYATPWIFFFPSILDVAGTIVDTAGLFYTSVSISQMLKGSVICFTYLITLFYLRKSLQLKKHLLMFVILLALTLIGYSNIEEQNQKYQPNPLLGNALIVLSQLLFSFMFIVEEKLLNKYRFEVVHAVSWQGIWGVIMCGVLLVVFSHNTTQLVQCDVLESCWLIYENPNLLVAIVLTFSSIGMFNYYGMSITKEASALHRCLVCTFRMVVVWVVSLGLGWQQFSFLQLIGYLVLTWAIFQFNKEDDDKGKEIKQGQEEGKAIQFFDDERQQLKEEKNEKTFSISSSYKQQQNNYEETDKMIIKNASNSINHLIPSK